MNYRTALKRTIWGPEIQWDRDIRHVRWIILSCLAAGMLMLAMAIYEIDNDALFWMFITAEGAMLFLSAHIEATLRMRLANRVKDDRS